MAPPTFTFEQLDARARVLYAAETSNGDDGFAAVPYDDLSVRERARLHAAARDELHREGRSS